MGDRDMTLPVRPDYDYWRRRALAAERRAESAEGEGREPVSMIDQKQRQSVAWDIIDEALNSYREFMLDDDYNAQAALNRIMERMKQRCKLYADTSAATPPGGEPTETDFG